MSLVGPRPHASIHNEKYARLIDGYLGRHRVKPGITGWAQVNGLRGGIDSIEEMKRRLEHDRYYVANWSLLLDIKILLMTLPAVLRGTNAY
jgi:putative colanic acid biosynthesis UDP-glucose lipid carrier transferase